MGPSSRLELVEPSQPRVQGGCAWVGGTRGTKDLWESGPTCGCPWCSGQSAQRQVTRCLSASLTPLLPACVGRVAPSSMSHGASCDLMTCTPPPGGGAVKDGGDLRGGERRCDRNRACEHCPTPTWPDCARLGACLCPAPSVSQLGASHVD